MKNFLPHAILLDFYGTVVEEDDIPIGKICNEISKVSPLTVTTAEIGSYWSHAFSQLCSQSFGTTFRSQKELEQLSLQRVLQHFKADLDSDALSRILYEYWVRPTIFPESREVLVRCKRPICLVSNIDNAELKLALKHCNLHFDWVVTSEDCRAYKPHAEAFEKALYLLDLPASEVLHVGDSFSSDVCGAKSLGIPVLWINREKKQISCVDEAPEYISTDLTGLLNLLEETDGIDIR